jgi:DNA-3-methyladenine glycosylase
MTLQAEVKKPAVLLKRTERQGRGKRRNLNPLCHLERREGPAAPGSKEKQVLRSAQDDNFVVSSTLNVLADVALLTAEFFDCDPRAVARELLGKLLIRKTAGGMLAGRVVETEAYLGEGDLAAHAVAGKTARNFVLFGPPGVAYVYFIYGNHYCLNVSCLPDGVPGCVLFRALEPVAGMEQMAEARGIALTRESDLKKISSGPGRMCEALGITRARDNGKSLVSPKSDLRLVDDGFRVGRVVVTQRIGITKSAEQPLRYVIGGNAFVSGRKT